MGDRRRLLLWAQWTNTNHLLNIGHTPSTLPHMNQEKVIRSQSRKRHDEVIRIKKFKKCIRKTIKFGNHKKVLIDKNSVNCY